MDDTTPAPVAAEPEPAEPAAAESAADPLRQYRTWAFRLFAILLGVVLIGSLLIFTQHDADPASVAIVLLVAALTVGVLGVVLYGLHRGAAWAIDVIAPTCMLIIVFGILRAVIALTQNSITVPLDVIAAAMVLSRPHPAAAMPALGPRDPQRVVLLVGAMVVTQVSPYLIGPVGKGGIFGVQPEDLDLSVAVACDLVEGGDAFPITVTWSWRRGELLSPAADGMHVSWFSSTNVADPGGGDGLYLPSEPRTSDRRIWQGGASPASGALDAIEPNGRFIAFGIDHGQGLFGGEVAVDLARSESTSTFGLIDVWVWYAHGGRWTERFEAEECQWGTQSASAG